MTSPYEKAPAKKRQVVLQTVFFNQAILWRNNMKSTLEHIRAFVCECPHLREAGIRVVGAGFSSGNVSACGDISASVEIVSNAVLTRYADGAMRRYYDFDIAICAPYGVDTQTNLDMALLCENIAAWVGECGRNGVFPQIDAGQVDWMAAKDVAHKAADTQNTAGTARYVVPCRMAYYVAAIA